MVTIVSEYFNTYVILKPSKLFEPDNIHSGISLENLGRHGGNDGILAKLKINGKVCLKNIIQITNIFY